MLYKYIACGSAVLCSTVAALHLGSSNGAYGGYTNPRGISITTAYDCHCKNSPTNRQSWNDGYDINTDAQVSWPKTGKTRKYNFEVSQKTLSPDGTPKAMMVVNGQFPGPPLIADWGDTIEVIVTNNMEDNGTSIHWHGISQRGSNNMDGVNGVTECPLAPGSSKTYKFVANEHGTTWYHSHHAVQYGDGIVGPIIINGPATANYDEDIGAMPISDLYYETIWEAALTTSAGGPTTADNGVINGTMVNAAKTTGSYNKVALKKGKTYRLRLVNTSVDNHFKVSLDNHQFNVIAADFVPMVPYSTSWLFIGIGQRYDVVFKADKDVDNYWFRAEVQNGCGRNSNNGNIRAIFSYNGAPEAEPTSTAVNYTQSCADETNLVPHVSKDVPEEAFPGAETLTVGGPSRITQGTTTLTKWTIDNIALHVDWSYPTLQYVKEGNTSYATDKHIVSLPHANAWSFWIIQANQSQTPPPGAPAGPPPSIPHPIHLHGHDFHVLGAGDGAFPGASALNFKNPTRRDVAMLSGWLVLGFQTDNPGAWLMHCHIAWHAGEGFAMQFLERVDDIPGAFSLNTLDNTCDDWRKYYANRLTPPDGADSGV